MFKTFTTLLLLAAIIFSSESITSNISPISDTLDCRKLYTEMNLSAINYKAFEQAMVGYLTLNFAKKDIITLIDFSKPSTEPRLYVINLKERKLLFSSLVAHGRNSGDNFATSFSNQNGSHKSSIGFFVTENTYQGKNGYSLVLNGLEKGINDQAKERAIVIHGAAYCNPSIVESGGRLGRSWGCPALPFAVNDSIINTIKGGTLLYIYANDNKYLAQSSIISQPSRQL